MLIPAQWKLAWLKLRAMTPAELGSRVHQFAYAAYERRELRRRLAGGADRAGGDDVRFAARVSAGRFFPSADRPVELRNALERCFAGETVAVIARAERMLEERVTLFHAEYDLAPSIDWQRDPRSGWRWPSVYHGDVLAASSPPDIDVKHVWELNRHQFLVELATASVLTGRPDFAAAVGTLVRGWIAQNPAGIGVNWAGPLEVAYRALSWLWAAHLIESRLAIDDDLRIVWARSLWEHGAFLHRHLELYSSPYNHLVGEASVLFALGLTFPAWPEAAKWQARGRQVLEERLSAQFYADGGSVEQAVVYHHATLGFYLLAALLARHNRADLSPQVWAAIERAIEWSARLVQPNGQLPALGDNDDARPIRFSELATWDFRHFQTLGAVLFDRVDFKALAGRFHQDALWLIGPGADAAFDAIPARQPTSASVTLAESGYVVLRSGWDTAADYVCFDAGPQAGGLRTDDVPSAAHGHADCLSVIAWLGGTPLFVDAGFYTYNRSPRWERWFRDTHAHNTLRVDVKSQASYLGKMTWANIPRARIEVPATATGARVLWARGSHDGYARGRRGVSHSRTVVLRPNAWLAIVDELTGADEHEFDLGYLCAPERSVLHDGGRIAIDQFSLRIAASCPLTIAVERGEAGASGWLAPSLDVLVPTSRIAASGRFAPPGITVLTFLSRAPLETRDYTIADDDWPLEVRRSASALLVQMQAAR